MPIDRNLKHDRGTGTGTIPDHVHVKSVRRIKLAKPIEVCDLTVDKYHNFALDAGVFVHNCERARAPHHEILKLRGVSINAQRQDPARVLGNREIKLLIKAIGIKPGETDLKKMRVGSITILTDADPDGKHIASLLLSFFKVYYPEIVRQKKLRSINGPLFLGQLRDTRFFGDTRDEVLSRFPEGQRNQVRITRFKGWGEASEDQLEHIAFNPKTRRLVVLTMGDEDEVRIAAVMGKDVEHRKELLFGTSNNQEN